MRTAPEAPNRDVRKVEVPGERPYDVVVGRDLLARIPSAVPESARRVAIVHAPIMSDSARELASRLRTGGRTALLIEVPEAESAKTVQVAAGCWDRLGEQGFTRTDVVVGFGGGATTDLAGFVAATWLRGVAVVQVPTTLLAMVDAAVGGKTGINTPAGKNLVGVFHTPLAVFCDLDLLLTLRPADLAAGMAEVVKAGFIADPTILALIESDPSEALDPSGPVIAELVERAIRVKADVVADDLTESLDRVLGREVLNYGHTLAHAIEQVEGYTWRHGDAVSVGMCFAAELSASVGLLPRADADRHREILSALGLPTRYPKDRWEDLVRAMRVDKKVRSDVQRFVVLREIGTPELLEAPDEGTLRVAFEAMR